MTITELENLLEALKDAGYGGYEVMISYEAGCSGVIHEVLLSIERETLYIGE